MRNASIDSNKERAELVLTAPGVEPQESLFPTEIDRVVLPKYRKFTPEAKARLHDYLRDRAEQVIQISVANAKENRLDTVSAMHVEFATTTHHPAPVKRFKKLAGIFGGVLLGAGISALISMLMESNVTPIGSTLALALGVVGTFLIDFEK